MRILPRARTTTSFNTTHFRWPEINSVKTVAKENCSTQNQTLSLKFLLATVLLVEKIFAGRQYTCTTGKATRDSTASVPLSILSYHMKLSHTALPQEIFKLGVFKVTRIIEHLRRLSRTGTSCSGSHCHQFILLQVPQGSSTTVLVGIFLQAQIE